MEASAVPRPAPTGVTGVASPQLLRLASDARLVVLVRQGWPAAFEAVYNRHHRGILSFCRHVLSDADEAEDAVQHTFLAAYNDLIASDKPIHLRAWLFTIARNRCYSILRARREQPAARLDEPVTEGLATQVQRRQDLRDLVLDLRGLPDDQRAALVLAELDALSHEEIGETLGVPREKVKALVFQARESLVASRTARETACADIREQLSNGRGGALRRANLRRHLRDCADCRNYRRQVERQRRQLAVLLPVAPTLALKETVLTGAVSSGAGLSGGGLLASSALKSGMFKGLATLMLATAGTAGTYVATHAFHDRPVAPRQHLPVLASSTAGLDPAHLDQPSPSIDRDTVIARSNHRGLAITGLTRLTMPVQGGDGVPNPFGPLAHSRADFPRKHVPSSVTIAPPKSNGLAPSTTTSPPPALASAPSATITSTSGAPSSGDGAPASDLQSARGNPGAASTGNARGAGGVPRTRTAGTRQSRGAGDGRRVSSGRAAGRPITNRSPTQGSRASASPSVGLGRAGTDRTAAGSSDLGTNAAPVTGLGAGVGRVLSVVAADAGVIATADSSAPQGGQATSGPAPSPADPSAAAPSAVALAEGTGE